MSELYRIKIQVPEGIIEREDDTEKRMKADGDYVETGWRVLGVPFGGPIDGRDLDGEAFTPETDIWLKVGDKVNLTYYHGFDPDTIGKKQKIPALIGRATYVGADERGHWFEPVLDIEEPLAQRLMKADITELRASSGAINHLVRKDAGGLISVWPVGELALFDINEWRLPANDFAVIEAKTEKIAEAIPEAEESAVDAVEESVEADNKSISIIPMEENTMDEEKIVKEEVKAEEPKEPKLDIKEELEALKRSVIEELKAAPGEAKGAPTVVKNAKESPSFVKALMAWAQGDNPRGFKGNDITMGAKGAWEGGEDTEGGYAVPDDFYNSIVEQREELSWVRQAPVRRFVTNRDRLLIPTEATAATKLVVVPEEGTYNENEPTFGQVAVTIHKATKMIKVSEELMDGDAVGLEAYITSIVARSSAAAENYYLTLATGNSEPQGIVAGATASGITSASKATITASELFSLMGKVASPYHNSNSGFLMAGLTKFHLLSKTDNNFLFIPTPSGGDILGYPIYIAPDMEAVGTGSGKAVLFGDFSMYAFAERQGVTLSRNPYLYQANGQIGLFVKQRFGGAVLQSAALKYLTLASQ
jgi:HK97 family phage major capsid protein